MKGKIAIFVILLFGSIPFASADFKAVCRVKGCELIGPARNGSCSDYIKQWRISAKYIVNTSMEGVAIPGTETEWYDEYAVSGLWSHVGIEFEPNGITNFPVYIFIPTKTDANGNIRVNPNADGYIMSRPANFGAAFGKYIVRCQLQP
jgi:hypothetical protein